MAAGLHDSRQPDSEWTFSRNASCCVFGPSWGKDGGITFYRPSSDGLTLSRYSVDPDGSGLTRLSTEAGASEYLWVKYELGLSPDGTWVACHDVEADRLVVVPVRGGGPQVTLLDPVTA